MNAYLATHPDIFMAQKEMHCFGSDLQFGPNFYRRTMPEYLAEFSRRNGELRSGESSVWYLYSTQAAAEIKAASPNAQIIIMLREPVELLHSLYCAFRADSNEHIRTFAEAVAAQDDRRSGHRLSRRAYFKQGLIYGNVPRYTEQVRRYFECFGREQVHIITYDQFAADTKTVYENVLSFLGVDPVPARDHFPTINDNHAPRSSLLKAIANDPLIRGNMIALRSWLPRPAFGALRKIETWMTRANVQYQKRAKLDPDLRRKLKLEFAPEIERLSELIGRDLTHWNRI